MRGLAVGAALVVAATPALAVHTIVWTEAPSALLHGEPDSVVVSPSGTLSLGPKVEPLSPRPEASDPSAENAITDPILWSSAVDDHGTLYLGTGNTGQILRLDPKGALTVLASLPEPLVTALLVTRRGEILAGTSPEGAIYRLQTGGEAKVFFEPGERYIWSLAEDANGNVYAGTGERGKIFRINTKGEGSLFFDSPEPHITSLVCDKTRFLVAGTDGTGMIYQIDAERRATVLYDSGYSEIASLAIDPAGTIFAAAIASGVGEVPSPAPRLVVRAPEGEPLVASPDEMGGVQPDTTPPKGRQKEALQAEIEGVIPGGPSRRAKEGGGAVFRLTPAGKIDELWRSTDEVPFAIVAAPDGSVFAGTGEPARLLRIEERGKAVAVARFPQDQATGLRLAGPGRLIVVTNNAGAAYRIERGLAESGSFVSQVRDVGPGARWGRIIWDAATSGGTRVEVQTRTGNSSSPDETWSDWSPPYADPEGSEIISPPGRFVQWKIRLLRSGQGLQSPVVRSVTVTYLPANHAPKLRELKLLSWSESRSESSSEEDQASGASRITVRAEPPETTEAPRHEGSGNDSGSGEPRKGEEEEEKKGPSAGQPKNRICVWHAEDPDGDRMVFRVLLQREGDERWTPVCVDRTESSCTFDEATIAEGKYRAKVIGNDAPSNYPGDELEAEDTSEVVVIDHTPPALEKLSGKPGSGPIEVRATDAWTPIETAEIMSGDRVVALARPLDGVLDSRSETLAIDLPAPWPKSVRLRVRDRAGNEAILTLD